MAKVLITGGAAKYLTVVRQGLLRPGSDCSGQKGNRRGLPGAV
ncbi:hypothetical protein [Neomoorella mulderi]|nr:hypothetical protein [Moorella mulderi]